MNTSYPPPAPAPEKTFDLTIDFEQAEKLYKLATATQNIAKLAPFVFVSTVLAMLLWAMQQGKPEATHGINQNELMGLVMFNTVALVVGTPAVHKKLQAEFSAALNEAYQASEQGANDPFGNYCLSFPYSLDLKVLAHKVTQQLEKQGIENRIATQAAQSKKQKNNNRFTP